MVVVDVRRGQFAVVVVLRRVRRHAEVVDVCGKLVKVLRQRVVRVAILFGMFFALGFRQRVFLGVAGGEDPTGVAFARGFDHGVVLVGRHVMDHVHDAVGVLRIVFKGAFRLFVVIEVGLGADFTGDEDVRIGRNRVGDVGAGVGHHQFVARFGLDVAVQLGHVGGALVVLRGDFVKEVAVDFVLAVQLQVFVHFGFDFFNRPRLVVGADVADVFDASGDVVVNQLGVVGIDGFADATRRVDDDIRHFAAARLVDAVPVGVFFPGAGGVFVGGDNHRLRADAAAKRRDVVVHVADEGVADFDGIGFRAFRLAVVMGIDGEVFRGLAFRDNHALDVPGEVGIAGVGAVVFDMHIDADVFARRFVEADGVGRFLAFFDAGNAGEGDVRRIGGRRRDEVAVMRRFRHDRR